MEYKPLKELEGNKEALRRIFYEITELQVPKITFPNGFIHLEETDSNGDRHELNIWHDGDVFYEINGQTEVLENPFLIVGIFQMLGYSA